jgi:predicted nuclease of predicted toxin-antitoxin system
LKLLIDEMYSPVLAGALRDAGVDVVTVTELGLAGSSDADVFSAAVSAWRIVLTENVADFARIAAQQSIDAQRHPGLLISLSSRFSRRRAGVPVLVAAVLSIVDESMDDRVVYLERNPPTTP